MKTKLFLIATLFISTITFSQSTKKGYDHYQAMSNTKMNKAELIDPIAKDANNSKKEDKNIGGKNPQTGKEINVARQTSDIHIRKRPGGTRATDYNSSRSNRVTSN